MELETEVSYVRRLAQARIEILIAEQERRVTGGSVADLIAALPRILADPGPRPDPAASRASRAIAPAPAIQWTRGREPLIVDDTLANLPTLSDESLEGTLGELRELEREVSERRRALHGVIDGLEAELARRRVNACARSGSCERARGLADGVEHASGTWASSSATSGRAPGCPCAGSSGRTGISNPYLSQIERGLRKPSAEILQQIARGLAISAETLYVSGRILEDASPGLGPSRGGDHRRATDLTDRQKQTLVEIYRSFKKA